MRAVALPNSPPAEKPWMSRATRIPIGAMMPIVSYDGITVISNVPTTINPIESDNAGLRPTRSAYEPRTMAPTGRIRNDAANVPSARSRELAGSVVGKKTWAT